MSENPFQSPIGQPPQGYAPGGPQNMGPQGRPQSFGRGYVKQVPVIASLMIVQGVLLLIFSLLMAGYAFFFSSMTEIIGNDPQQPPQMKEMLEFQERIMPIIFGVMGGVSGLLSIMNFIAAYFGFTYRYRMFGIASMIIGLFAMLTFYCAPTAVGLAVYGMIIYFNPAVRKAFELRKSGMTKEEMMTHFPY